MSVRLRAAGALTVLVALSLWLRSTALHAGFWIDEGLSVGIASHPLADIPGVLRQDGSPPLYYLLLGGWIRIFGDGQATTHVLSLIFALLLVPAAWLAARRLVGVRAGWYAAALAAVNPFVTYYAQETRMYALVCLLGLLVAWLFAEVFAAGNRELRIPAGLAIAALIYTHNWGLFLAAGTTVALVPALARRSVRAAALRDAAVVYGIAAVLYLPWAPSLLFQAAHTGAPWSERPSLADLLGPISGILGGQAVPLGLLLAAGAGLASRAQREPPADGTTAGVLRPVWTLVAIPLAGVLLAWLASQMSPAFTGRYFAVFVGPVLLLAAAGLAAAGRLGVVCLLIVLALWIDPRTRALERKSDARVVAARLAPHLHPGDLVVSVHPEQAPLLHYYLPGGLRYATSLGRMPDPQVFDWRDALDRLRAAQPRATLGQLVTTLRPGQRLALVLPIIRTARWTAPWTSLVRRRSREWQRAADRDPLLQRLLITPRFGHRPLPRGVYAVVYTKR